MLALLPAYSAQIFASAAKDPGLKDVFATKGEGFGPKRLRLGNTSMKNAKYKKNEGEVPTWIDGVPLSRTAAPPHQGSDSAALSL